MLKRDPERQSLDAVCRGCIPHHSVCYSTRRFIEILLIYLTDILPISPSSVSCFYVFWWMGYTVGGGTCTVDYLVQSKCRRRQKCIFLEGNMRCSALPDETRYYQKAAEMVRLHGCAKYYCQNHILFLQIWPEKVLVDGETQVSSAFFSTSDPCWDFQKWSALTRPGQSQFHWAGTLAQVLHLVGWSTEANTECVAVLLVASNKQPKKPIHMIGLSAKLLESNPDSYTFPAQSHWSPSTWTYLAHYTPNFSEYVSSHMTFEDDGTHEKE